MILSPNAIQRVRQVFSFLFILLGVWIAFITPPDGLSPQTMKALGITVWAVGWWITQIVPEYVTGLLMCVFWAATKCVPFQTAFATFSTSGWWIMVGAFALGAVAGKTGSSSASPCACCICSRRPSRGRSGGSSPRVRSFLRSFQALTQRQRFPRPSR